MERAANIFWHCLRLAESAGAQLVDMAHHYGCVAVTVLIVQRAMLADGEQVDRNREQTPLRRLESLHNLRQLSRVVHHNLGVHPV